MQTPTELERALAAAGGANAPRERSAQLSRLLAEELERGARELAWRSRPARRWWMPDC